MLWYVILACLVMLLIMPLLEYHRPRTFTRSVDVRHYSMQQRTMVSTGWGSWS